MFAPPVYASVTSIPSRVERILEPNLHHLLQQTYAHFQGILLTLPQTNRRGQAQPVALPPGLTQNPRIQVFRPEQDSGPIMKWLGPAQANMLPADAWVFVCDDDQQFEPAFVADCVARLGALPADQRATAFTNTPTQRHILGLFGVRQMLWGYQGVLVPLAALRVLQQQYEQEAAALPACCWNIDDDVVATWLYRAGYRVQPVPSGLSKYSIEAVDSLGADLWQRTRDRHYCHRVLNATEYTGNLAAVLTAAVVAVIVLVVGLVGWKQRFFWPTPCRGAAPQTVSLAR